MSRKLSNFVRNVVKTDHNVVKTDHVGGHNGEQTAPLGFERYEHALAPQGGVVPRPRATPRV